MNLSVYLFPLLAGYLFLRFCYYFKFRIVRESGYHVFFQSGLWGVVFLVVSQAIDTYFPTLANYTWRFLGIRDDQIGIGLLSIASSAISIPLLNWIVFNKYNCAVASATNRGGEIEVLLYRSIKEEIPVEITLKNRRCYVGLIYDTSGITKFEDGDIKLLPQKSGYRDKDTLKLDFDTDYRTYYADKILSEYLEDDESSVALMERFIDFFEIVIPQSEVVSVRRFDIEIYEGYFKNSI